MQAIDANGVLQPVKGCYIRTPDGTVQMYVLPDINGGKGSSYTDEVIPGRSSPIKNWVAGETATVSWTIHFVTTQQSDIQRNINDLRNLESALFPRLVNTNGAPFAPPPICTISCGQQFSAAQEVCTILRNLNYKMNKDCVWDEETLMPYFFDVDLNFEIVYATENLPGQENVLVGGF